MPGRWLVVLVALFADTDRAMFAQDNVVEHLDADCLARLFEIFGYLQVFLAGGGITRRMIVYENNGRGSILNGRAKYFSRVDQAGI